MRTITVALGEKTYNIEIAAGLLDQIGAKARVLSQAVKAAIISDSNVDPLYGERLERSPLPAVSDWVRFMTNWHA
ncbi:MAG: hypothetical protein EP149_05460 [Phascolarctobacterium sp.]|nr:hypothetical protein [Phascolarctobacterium sp.]